MTRIRSFCVPLYSTKPDHDLLELLVQPLHHIQPHGDPDDEFAVEAFWHGLPISRTAGDHRQPRRFDEAKVENCATVASAPQRVDSIYPIGCIGKL